METVHISVLLKESIEGLNLNDNSIVVDATFGGGGHTREILKNFKNVKVIAFDSDGEALKRAEKNIAGYEDRIIFKNLNFKNIKKGLLEENISLVDGVLFDLGISSDQLDQVERGFSFLRNEKLLMTMKENLNEEDLTAYEIVNTWEESSLADIIYGYGEEKYARRIARNIVEVRKEKPIETTFDLVNIINSSVPVKYQKGKIHPATRTFQAIRIAVNDELRVLEEGLRNALEVVKKDGRISVITFHSLEDRIVKNFFRNNAKEGKLVLINKKPIVPSLEEIKNNKRSRSAKLRIIQKL
ncbi:MAG: 16S rRNA (cytosine(1402)-N(4))-methyltransferase RsmH [Candidatus Pacebacteria bacterium]|nr:16S rRNA (cytosine(1402)-N(4))-methyltransferase RsmH [Candidatus Paceibacterota bacterium]